jgi:hypothetical protein
MDRTGVYRSRTMKIASIRLVGLSAMLAGGWIDHTAWFEQGLDRDEAKADPWR